MKNQNLKRIKTLSFIGLFLLLFLLIYIINAAPSVKSMYGDVTWANSQIEQQGTLADLAVFSKEVVNRFQQTQSAVQSVFGVVLILTVLGIVVLVGNLILIRRLNSEIKNDKKD